MQWLGPLSIVYHLYGKIFIESSNDVDHLGGHPAPVAQSVEHGSVRSRFDSGRTNTQGLKITEEKVLPLYKRLDFQVFSDKDYKP